MAEVRLKAYKREATGKGPARRARAEGKLPGVIYGRGMDPVSIAVERRDLALALQSEAGMNVLLDIELDGEAILSLTKELQRDPVKGRLLHVDFMKVDRTQEVDVEVPVQLVGESGGVSQGGVLEQPLHVLQVRCLPHEVPETIRADISGLGLGDTLKVSDLGTDESFQILNDPDTVVAHVTAPISQEELEAMEAAVAGGVEEGIEAEREALKAEPEAVEAETGPGAAETGAGPEARAHE